ncbi:hypothetical protein [Amycolatopsis sp. Hca4]|uniref:hypothetical protein n=1 Tax=Amycolatopsis sp. Hca4 TaxID=2742131 RepID=UPI0015922654|nr:hypothetical protein [Amycolatopsis sp. Hca4]QKV73929.1 hypothetical protein HUT10_09210 [Amycolatopsis sp. Hca4]
MKKYRILAGVFAALAASMIAAPASAHAGTAQARHCVADVKGSSVCFGSYRQAMAYATGSRITDAPEDTRQAAHDPGFTSRMSAVSGDTRRSPAETRIHAAIASGVPVIGAVIFDGYDYTGSSYTFMVAKPCVKDNKVDYAWSFNPRYWQNKVSSVQAWANCWIWLYNGQQDRFGPWKADSPRLDPAIDNRSMAIDLS